MLPARDAGDLHARDRSRDEERPHATALCSARLAASGWYPICHLRPAGCNGAALVTGDAQLFGITGASGPTRALLERGDAGSDRVVPIAVVNG